MYNASDGSFNTQSSATSRGASSNEQSTPFSPSSLSGSERAAGAGPWFGPSESVIRGLILLFSGNRAKDRVDSIFDRDLINPSSIASVGQVLLVDVLVFVMSTITPDTAINIH